MNGQMTIYEKDKLIQDYIEKANPYKKLEPLKFDLRGYAKYLEEHSISGKDVPEDVMNKFVLN